MDEIQKSRGAEAQRQQAEATLHTTEAVLQQVQRSLTRILDTRVTVVAAVSDHYFPQVSEYGISQQGGPLSAGLVLAGPNPAFPPPLRGLRAWAAGTFNVAFTARSSKETTDWKLIGPVPLRYVALFPMEHRVEIIYDRHFSAADMQFTSKVYSLADLQGGVLNVSGTGFQPLRELFGPSAYNELTIEALYIQTAGRAVEFKPTSEVTKAILLGGTGTIEAVFGVGDDIEQFVTNNEPIPSFPGITRVADK